MENQLEQNLPIVLRKKPIVTPQRAFGFKSEKSDPTDLLPTASYDGENGEESKRDPLIVKSIKYLNPLNYFVTPDGYTFPLTSKQSLGPIRLVNLSNRVRKVDIDKSSGTVVYHMVPRFDLSDVMPWERLVDKLKHGGYAEYHNLMVAFEDLMRARQEWMENMRNNPKPDQSSLIDTLQEMEVSDKLPQMVEIRELENGCLPNFPLNKYIVNKPMRKLLGISEEDDLLGSLDRGVMALKYVTRSDSVIWLQKYFENQAKHFRDDFQTARKETQVSIITRLTADGMLRDFEVTSKMMRHGKDLAWVYTFRILNRKEKNMLPNKRENLFNDISTDQSLCDEEEQDKVSKKKQEAIDFLMKFNYREKFIFADPPKERVCRIRELKPVQ